MVEKIYGHVDMRRDENCEQLNNKSTRMKDVFKTIIARYMSSDYSHIDLGMNINTATDVQINTVFKEALQNHENKIFMTGIFNVIDVEFIRRSLRDLISQNHIKKKLRFEYRSNNPELSERYSRVINGVFREVAANYPRVTDNYMSRADLVYDIYIQMLSSKFVCSFFPHLVNREIQNVYGYIRTNPVMAPYYEKLSRLLIQREAIYDLFQKGQLPDISAEFKNQGNIWNIALIDTVGARNKRVLYLKKYEVFIDFINSYVSQNVRKLAEIRYDDIMRQIGALKVRLLDPYLDQDERINVVYGLYESGKIQISNKCMRTLLELDKLFVGEWEVGELQLENNPPILDDFAEINVIIEDDTKVAPSFYSSNAFGFLYLNNVNRPIKLETKRIFTCTRNYALFYTYQAFLKFSEEYAYSFIKESSLESIELYKSNRSQSIKNGMAICAMEVLNEIANTVDLNRITKRQVYVCDNEFLGSKSATISKEGSNFIGNYVTLLSRLVQLPMMRNPNISEWVKTTQTVGYECPTINVHIRDLKGLKPSVAKFLIFAFAMGAVNEEIFRKRVLMNDPFFG